MEDRGMFIVLEGIDGVGTTSMTEEIREHFNARGFSMQSTREPYSAVLTPILRHFISGKLVCPGWRAMSMLFTADRHIHCRDLEDVLNGGMNIICDRYIGSTAAYQTAQASDGEQEHALQYVMGPLSDDLLVPDLAIYLRGDASACHDRIIRRNIGLEDYEQLEFQYRVSDWYEAWLREEVKRNNHTTVVVVDATRQYADVRSDCLSAVNMLFDSACRCGAVEHDANSPQGRPGKDSDWEKNRPR